MNGFYIALKENMYNMYNYMQNLTCLIMAYFLIIQYKTEPVLQQTSSGQLLIQITDADSLQAQWKNLLALKDWQ